jgi:hypothetical protein
MIVVGGSRLLSDAFASSPDRLHAMGERGRAYVQRYDWSMIAEDMLDAYRWMLGRVSLPTYIHKD